MIQTGPCRPVKRALKRVEILIKCKYRLLRIKVYCHKAARIFKNAI